jgi:predicted ABC-type ATPase
MKMPTLILLAGPNGAGKSTFYDHHFAGLKLPFVNSDLIARREFGEDAEERPFTAAKVARAERAGFLASSQSFVTETVLASTPGGVRRLLEDARSAGFRIEAHYIGLWPPFLSIARVAIRVAAGGHDIPDEIIIKRWHRSLANVPLLMELAESLAIYDNTDSEDRHRLVASYASGRMVSCVKELPRWTACLDLPGRRSARTVLL